MKSLIYKIAFCLIICCTISNVSASDGKKEFTKTIKETFDITPDGTVELYNKHGDVTVKTWAQNQVKIEVIITVNASSESNAQPIFDRIKIEFSNSSSFVKAETEIAAVTNTWMFGLVKSFSYGNNDDYSIDYEVHLPATNRLQLNNKHGNAYVSSLQNNADISIKFGRLQMEELDGNLNISLGHGKGNIKKVRNLDLNIYHSSITIEESNDVEVESKHSTIYFDKVEKMNSQSKHDNYEFDSIKQLHFDGKHDNIKIGTVETLSAVGQFTDFKIGNVLKSIDMDVQHGGAVIKHLSKDFEEVRLNGQFTDFTISIESGAEYLLDASGSFSSIRYPENMEIYRHIEKGNSKEVEGYLGNKDVQRKIKARLQHGGMKLKVE